MPVAHLLALAPLTVWLKMLYGHKVHPRYWFRLLGVGFTSLVGTIWSLPERVIFGFSWSAFKKNKEQLHHQPGVLVILGYYRSGTTHAHNLIACDSGVVTPRWYQALLGQGFWLSWAVTRFLLVPFLGSSRPQDGVGFGPLWPAEDDFALAGWSGCSTLPGRLIFPSRWDKWQRWNTLEECTETERARWRRTLAGFAWKITRRHPQRMLVLKSPNHGAHITELTKVFGDRVRFLHISREPTKVIESNIRMHEALSMHLLEDPLETTTLRARIVNEYLKIETATISQAQSLDEGRIAFITHENLITDPIGELSKGFGSINLQLSELHKRAIVQYLSDLGTYERPLHTPIDLGTPTESEPESIEQLRTLRSQHLQTAPVPLPKPDHPSSPVRIGLGMLGIIGSAIAWGVFWIGLIWIIKQEFPDYRPRLDQLVWIGGSVFGLVAVRVAGGGSRSLGFTAAIMTLTVFLSVSFPITVVNWHFAQDGSPQEFLYHNSKGALHGLLAPSSIIYAVLGMLTAWRHASETGPKAPGT